MAYEAYITPILLFNLGWILYVLFLGLNRLIAPKTKEKIGPDGKPISTFIAYECGEIPVGDAHQRFSFQYYIFALVFVPLDLISLFLFLWAIIAVDQKLVGLLSALAFLGVVLVGFLYWWRRDALKWM